MKAKGKVQEKGWEPWFFKTVRKKVDGEHGTCGNERWWKGQDWHEAKEESPRFRNGDWMGGDCREWEEDYWAESREDMGKGKGREVERGREGLDVEERER